MGFDSMAAWDKSSYDLIHSGADLCTYSPVTPTGPPTLSFSYEGHSRPSFQHATSRWSPPHSPINSTPHSNHTSPSTSSAPQFPHTNSAIQTSPVLTPRDRASLTSKLYAAACAGDLAHIALLHSLNAPINAATPVKHLYSSFKPAKHGHLSPLAGAASHNQLPTARLLLALGAHVNPDLAQSSSAPLHQACIADDLPMAAFLITQGADVNAQNCYRTTPLMYAIKYASVPLIALLLSYNPDLSLVSLMGTSALHWAILQNTRPVRREILRLLLRAGADADQRMSDESAPLHCAALGGLTDLVQVLLLHGADPQARNSDWMTPLDVAVANGHAETAQLLRCWES